MYVSPVCRRRVSGASKGDVGGTGHLHLDVSHCPSNAPLFRTLRMKVFRVLSGWHLEKWGVQMMESDITERF